jgi:predicted O-methyltransferase YrrM
MIEETNWFAGEVEKNFFDFLISEFLGKPVKFLQIGAYTGDASVWLFNNIISTSNSTLVDVDTWEGSDEPSHHKMNWTTVETLYDAKTKFGRENRKIIKYKGTSDSFFANNREKYDFIYIDGDHTSYGVIKDAVAAYECLNMGGIIAFDDYMWSAGLGVLNEPKLAIDAFWNIYQGRLELILRDYQCWFRKVA